jgi:hypothetical protein
MCSGGGSSAPATPTTAAQNQAAITPAGVTVDQPQGSQEAVSADGYLLSEARRKAAQNGGTNSTLLTGSAGVDPASMSLGRTSLLGA